MTLVPSQPRCATRDTESHQTRESEVTGSPHEVCSVTPVLSPRKGHGWAPSLRVAARRAPRTRVSSCAGCVFSARDVVPHFDIVTKLLSVFTAFPQRAP